MTPPVYDLEEWVLHALADVDSTAVDIYSCNECKYYLEGGAADGNVTGWTGKYLCELKSQPVGDPDLYNCYYE